mmetsp:Transcript_35351/g.80789  ORF Transcript_35351/g.80789 Transcript_35351/m.80789 type:complete len:204 (-) Transcript_35351:1107-1718(-)
MPPRWHRRPASPATPAAPSLSLSQTAPQALQTQATAWAAGVLSTDESLVAQRQPGGSGALVVGVRRWLARLGRGGRWAGGEEGARPGGRRLCRCGSRGGCRLAGSASALSQPRSCTSGQVTQHRVSRGSPTPLLQARQESRIQGTQSGAEHEVSSKPRFRRQNASLRAKCPLPAAVCTLWLSQRMRHNQGVQLPPMGAHRHSL